VISIIIRTKNEERWLRQCLTAIGLQHYRPLEVVVVDNASKDGTVKIAEEFGCRIIYIDDNDFSFGRALNRGIKAAHGELVVMLSGHCIPVNEKWLTCLTTGLLDEKVVGVYGRQEPLPDSDPFDKRDLWTTFGLERRIQSKDFFFHNANSLIRRSTWEEISFDEDISGVEDRDWAKKVLARGYNIVYEPSARVYHYHGIHQGRNVERAERVARVIELIHNGGGKSES
jgi:glycosyltransferase involved in cell wall biosynthesis